MSSSNWMFLQDSLFADSGSPENDAFLDLGLSGTAASSDKTRGQTKKRQPMRRQQQQLLELEAELEAKTKQLAEAEMHQQVLKRKLRVLETVLPLREQQIAMLKETSQEPAVLSQPNLGLLQLQDAPSFTAAESACAGLSPSSISDMHKQTDSGSGVDGSGVEEILRPGHGAARGTSSPAPCGVPPANDASIPSFSRPSSSGVPHTPPERIQEFVRLWHDFIRDASLQLHLHDSRTNDPGPTAELSNLHDSMLSACRAIRLQHPRMFTDLLAVNLATGARCEAAPEGLWIAAARGLRPTASQIADCRAARTLFRDRMSVILRERCTLVRKLCGLLGDIARAEEEAGRAQRSQVQLRLYVEAEEVTAQLARNVDAEGHCTATSKDFMGVGLFDKVQMCRACILSHPYFPDAVAMINAIVTVGEEGATGGAEVVPAVQPAP